MPHEHMLTLSELDDMADLSSSALYSAEVKRIPFLTPDEQATYIEAASAGDENARHELILNCLNWTLRKAGATYRDRTPKHTDVMDLAAQANMKMLEALPNALAANNTVSYLMGVSACEMQLYCLYHDPLIKRSRDRPITEKHPTTVSVDRQEELVAAGANT